MKQPDTSELVAALVSLAARVDALTWVSGALLRSHPDPAAVLAAWRDRQTDAADSGFEIASQEYRDKFLGELQLWTGTLEAEVQQAAHRPKPSRRDAEP